MRRVVSSAVAVCVIATSLSLIPRFAVDEAGADPKSRIPGASIINSSLFKGLGPVALSPDGETLYALNDLSGSFTYDEILAVDLTDDTVTQIATGSTLVGMDDIAVDDNGDVFVVVGSSGNNGEIRWFDESNSFSEALLADDVMGGGPIAIRGDYVYVAREYSEAGSKDGKNQHLVSIDKSTGTPSDLLRGTYSGRCCSSNPIEDIFVDNKDNLYVTFRRAFDNGTNDFSGVMLYEGEETSASAGGSGDVGASPDYKMISGRMELEEMSMSPSGGAFVGLGNSAVRSFNHGFDLVRGHFVDGTHPTWNENNGAPFEEPRETNMLVTGKVSAGVGSGLNDLNKPKGVAVSADHVVFVSDWGNDRIVVVGPGDCSVGATGWCYDVAISGDKRRYLGMGLVSEKSADPVTS